MEINDLIKISKQLNAIGTQVGLWNTINQLRSSLTQYIQQRQSNPAAANQFKSNIEQFRIELISQLNQIQGQLINIKEYKTYKKLHLDDVFGKQAINLLSRLQTEIDTEPEKINSELTIVLNKAIQLQQLFSPLTVLFPNIPNNNKIEEDQITLFFENGANVENLKELSKISQDWNLVIHCLSRLVKENDTESKIIAVERGSLIITIGAIASIVIAITKISDKVLDQILKIYEIKKKSLELKNMKIAALDDAISILDKQSKLNVSNEATRITTELLSEYVWKTTDELYNETKTFLSKAIRIIIRFTNLGGKIEPKLLNANNEEQEALNLQKEKTIKFINKEEEVQRLEGAKEFLQLEDKEEIENLNIKDN